MTREELKTHCEKEIEMCEFWARCKGENLNNSKIYQEHKLVLELLEQEPCEDTINRQKVLDLIKNKYGMFSHPEVISKFIKLEEEINDL